MIAAMLAVALLRDALPEVAVAVDVAPAHVLNRVVPMRAIGAGLDAENPGSVPEIYGPADVTAMRGAGLGPVTYRLYTELSVQDWHWNPRGSWSDAARGEGYWTGSALPGATITDSYGYRLPERGDTHDQGNDGDYSRLDDGNPATYWKSNPYLTQPFTHEADALHPQWVIVDLGARRAIDAVALTWANPYATDYRVQYWNGPDAMYSPANGRWIDFPGGVVSGGTGGKVVLTLGRAPLSVEFVRVRMSASSGTCDSHGSADARNCLGYALGEIGLGTLDGSGAFHDVIRHARNRSQTVTYASSTDPWNAPPDRVTNEVQPGLDAVFDSGVTGGLPALVPVSLLYGTPDDAAAEIAYLQARGDVLRGVELGEEPDGQFVAPEDYAALYVQWARRLHARYPALSLGGPVFQGSRSDVQTWRNAAGDASWLHRFIAYLAAHRALDLWNFMSFEHYPFGACDPSPYDDLQYEPALATGIVDVWHRDGVPPNMPLLVTEMNFSANATSVFQDVPGALWFADAVGSFLSAGASAAYLYQYAPEPMQRTATRCNTWGSYGMFTGTRRYAVRQKTAQYFAASLLSSQWAQPVDAPQSILPTFEFSFGKTIRFVSSYAIARPDGRYAVLLIDKDPIRQVPIELTFRDGPRVYRFAGPVTIATFGRAQYVWHGDGPNGYANPDGPVAVRRVIASRRFVLEPGSITVVRGRILR